MSSTAWDKARAEEAKATRPLRRRKSMATKVETGWSLPAVDRAKLGMGLTDEEQADLARADADA